MIEDSFAYFSIKRCGNSLKLPDEDHFSPS